MRDITTDDQVRETATGTVQSTAARPGAPQRERLAQIAFEVTQPITIIRPE
ncbi:hypothetical protein ACX9R5_09370 [Rathayibacter sp. CAU 1779]